MNRTLQAFGFPGTCIKEYEHWVALFRPQQVTVGSLVLAEKSDAIALGEISAQAWSEFSKVSKEMETLLHMVFKAEKFNYLALMMKDPNVHFHFIPRYSQPVEIAGSKLVDSDWPSKTEMRNANVSNSVLEEIKTKLVTGLK